MEEMMTLMMTTAAHENTRNHNTITTSSSSSPLPSWKLYDNPFYYFSQQHQHPHHHLQFPSLCNLTLLPPMVSPSSIQSELDLARARIEELKAEIEFERRLRKKAESTNKRLEKEVLEERKRREATARLCEELTVEITSNKAAIEGMKKDMEEERRMMRIAEVWREERVQMKLEEARILMEKKMSEEREAEEEEESKALKEKRGEDTLEIPDFMMGAFGNSSCNGSSGENKVRSTSQRRGSPEAENPHIRRGIKGFVEEFPRAVRAVGSRGRQSGSNLECQRAQLRLLLRHKNPVGLGVAGPDNLNLVV